MKKLIKSLNAGSSKLNKPASHFKSLSGSKNINGKPGGSIVEGSYSVYEINPTWP